MTKILSLLHAACHDSPMFGSMDSFVIPVFITLLVMLVVEIQN